ncbi:hypothetical protein DL96DRAFT_1637718 [Flagelloscypha sp. PMI_526]|nr:hypothetical protein DL96DRAFT_1637718 [Flagelloscypha sp. PMI_526]
MTSEEEPKASFNSSDTASEFSQVAHQAPQSDSPFSTFLPELLYEVLRAIVSSHDLPTSALHHSRADNCLTLSRVCRSWRQYINCSPDLWSFIRIHSTGPDETLLPKLALWLERSKDSLLDIIVLIGNAKDSGSENQTRCLFKLLTDHSKKWETIHLIFPNFYSTSDPFRRALDDENLELPRLRTVILTQASHIPLCFKNARRVKSLHFRAYRDEGVHPVQLLSGSQNLQTLSLFGGCRAKPKDIFNCLQRHPGLISLSVGMEVENWTVWDATSFRFVSVPNLCYLELRHACHVLRTLECPTLQELCLGAGVSSHYGLNEEGTPFVEGLSDVVPSFLGRSPSVKTLRVHPVSDLLWLRDIGLVGNSLEHLYLEVMYDPNSPPLINVDRVSGNNSNPLHPVLLPHLATVSVNFRSPALELWHLRHIEEIVEFLPSMNRQHDRSHCGLALCRMNISFRLYTRAKCQISWVHEWRRLEKHVLPEAVYLTISIPKGQLGEEREDMDVKALFKEVEINDRQQRKIWNKMWNWMWIRRNGWSTI